MRSFGILGVLFCLIISLQGCSTCNEYYANGKKTIGDQIECTDEWLKENVW